MPTVSFAADVAPLFTDKDLGCMARHSVNLNSYDYMADPNGDVKYDDHANARHVFARLAGTETPRMPSGGPFWSASNLAVLKGWMDGGFIQ